MNCGKTEKKQIVETGGIKGNLEEVPSNVDLEKEIEGTTGDYAEGRRLEQRILEESRRFPEVSFAKLSRIAKHFYDFGKQERFVEPQGLEEAALKAYPKMSRISEPHGVIPADNKCHNLGDANKEKREGFITGAKWMAKQGFSFEDEVRYDGKTPFVRGVDVNIFELRDSVKEGDKVIVQIRKKD